MSRTPHQLLPVLRIAAVASAIGLVAGYVVLAQRQTNPHLRGPSANAPTVVTAPHAEAPAAFMPGSKNGTLILDPLIPSNQSTSLPLLPVVAPGSKTFVGKIVVEQMLTISPPPSTPSPTPAVIFVAPSSKGTGLLPQMPFASEVPTPVPQR